MPWKLSNLMDERLKFVARLLDGEKMVRLCHEFGISRKTGYKIFNRYKECGLEGLANRSQRPTRPSNQIPFQIERFILRSKKERPSWRPQDPQETDSRLSEYQSPCQTHCACCSGPSWIGETP